MFTPMDAGRPFLSCNSTLSLKYTTPTLCYDLPNVWYRNSIIFPKKIVFHVQSAKSFTTSWHRQVKIAKLTVNILADERNFSLNNLTWLALEN